jgi:hypothetical protein
MFNTLYFDKYPKGRGGWTLIQILNNISNWLAETGPPEIVLFSVPEGNGTLQNLPYNQTTFNIHNIIHALQNANPTPLIIGIYKL